MKVTSLGFSDVSSLKNSGKKESAIPVANPEIQIDCQQKLLGKEVNFQGLTRRRRNLFVAYRLADVFQQESGAPNNAQAN